MYLQSLHFTSLYVWKTNENSEGESFIKMTETLNMKINETFVSQKRTGKSFLKTYDSDKLNVYGQTKYII